MTVTATASGPARASVTPLFVMAGSHASLHWTMATFYILQPFIKDAYGLTYAQVGVFASILHISAVAMNVPAGIMVDLTGRRLLFQIMSLACTGTAIAAVGIVGSYWAIALCAAMISAMNTLWHPAAISYLSTRYEHRRGFALSFHTVGASIGEAVAPIAVAACIATLGWQAGAFAGAAAPAIAVVLLIAFFTLGNGESEHLRERSQGGVRGYVSGMRGLVRDSRIWLICLVTGFRGTTQAGLLLFLPLYLADGFGAGAMALGMFMFLFQGAGGLATPFVGAASDRIGRRTTMLFGTAATTAIVMLLPAVDSFWAMAVTVPMAGAAVYALRPVLQGWALEMTPPALGGSMVSLLFGTQSAFSMAVPILGGLIADAWGVSTVFYLFAAAAAGAFLISLAIPDDRRAR